MYCLVSIPLKQGGVFRHNLPFYVSLLLSEFQSLWSRARSFDGRDNLIANGIEFQSLWSRAGSFDRKKWTHMQNIARFNPFQAGRCLSTLCIRYNRQTSIKFQSLWNRAGSFDAILGLIWMLYMSVSIPLEQGGVFRPVNIQQTLAVDRFQSLCNRAGSFDIMCFKPNLKERFNPFVTRAGSFDFST